MDGGDLQRCGFLICEKASRVCRNEDHLFRRQVNENVLTQREGEVWAEPGWGGTGEQRRREGRGARDPRACVRGQGESKTLPPAVFPTVVLGSDRTSARAFGELAHFCFNLPPGFCSVTCMAAGEALMGSRAPSDSCPGVQVRRPPHQQWRHLRGLRVGRRTHTCPKQVQTP